MTFDKRTLDGLRIERPTEPERRKPFLAITAIAVFIAVAGGAFVAIRHPQAAHGRVAAAVAATPSSHGAVLNASGYVTARRQATVSSKVTGKVVDVEVEEGLH